MRTATHVGMGSPLVDPTVLSATGRPCGNGREPRPVKVLVSKAPALMQRPDHACTQALDPLFPLPPGHDAPPPLDGFEEITLLPELAGLLPPKGASRASSGAKPAGAGAGSRAAAVGRSVSMPAARATAKASVDGPAAGGRGAVSVASRAF